MSEVNNSAVVDLRIHRDNLMKENKQLRDLLEQATNDCRVAQESLDGAQREIERLSEQWELVVKRDLR